MRREGAHEHGVQSRPRLPARAPRGLRDRVPRLRVAAARSTSTGRSTGSTSSPPATTGPALWIVDDDDTETRLSFAELSARSDALASWLREHGVHRGDRILLMLGNQPALWECMLALTKLGAVMIPSTTLLTPAGHRGSCRARRCRAGHRRVGAGRPVRRHRGRLHAYRGRRAGRWMAPVRRFHERRRRRSRRTARRPASDPLFLYFTSGTTAQPKLVEHTQVSYPIGHLSTMYWLGLRPGDVHLNISSPGWAKHAWSNVFAPVERRGDACSSSTHRASPHGACSTR